MARMRRVISLAMVILLSSGCSWFGDENEPVEIKPNPLPKIKPEVSISTVWSKKIGQGVGEKALRIEPKIHGKRVISASPDGKVKSHFADSGKEIWTVDIKDIFEAQNFSSELSGNFDVLTGGVEANSEHVFVCSATGHLVALNQIDGSFAWKATISSESLSPPKVDNDLLVVQTIDGKVAAYDASDGSKRWEYAAKIPPLTLRGTSTPAVYEDIVIAGFSNGRIAFITRDDGLAAYERIIGVPEGVSDLEKLVDLDGKMAIENNILYIAGYQGRLIAIDLRAGEILWEKEASSLVGVSVGFGNVYLISADGKVIAYNGTNGREVWRVEALLNRNLNAPLVTGSFVAFTDFEGYLHLLAQSDGRFVARTKVDSRGVGARLAQQEGRIYALGNGGTLSVLEIR
mgnify:CR=1 FL=1